MRSWSELPAAAGAADAAHLSGRRDRCRRGNHNAAVRHADLLHRRRQPRAPARTGAAPGVLAAGRDAAAFARIQAGRTRRFGEIEIVMGLLAAVQNHGYAATALILFLSSCGLPLPLSVVLLTAGGAARTGRAQPRARHPVRRLGRARSATPSCILAASSPDGGCSPGFAASA